MVPWSVAGLSQLVGMLLPEPHAALLSGLLFGSKASFSPDLYAAMVKSGTLHIVALSGQNIAIMEDLIGVFLVPFVGKRRAAVCTIGLVIWFVWFVGPSASIVRAAIMGSIGVLAIVSGRQYWAVLSWMIAVGIMLIVRFSWITDISFQLSAGASLGIILFGKSPRLHAMGAGVSGRSLVSSLWSAVRVGCEENLRLTLAAQVLTVPIILLSFHRMSLISPIANLAIGWVIAPVTLLGWMTVFLGFFVLYAGQVIAWIDWVLLEYLIRTIRFMSQVPFAGFGW